MRSHEWDIEVTSTSPSGLKSGYCKNCFADMLLYSDGKVGHYKSHTAAKNLGLWGKMKAGKIVEEKKEVQLCQFF
jgi:hypothetical protein